MNNILWISAYVPYDSVPHAGGKNHNYYLKQIYKKNKNVRLISFYSSEEINKIDLDQYGIKNQLIRRSLLPTAKVGKLFYSLMNRLYQLNLFTNCLHYKNYKDLKALYKLIKKIKKDELYNPSVVFLQWTEMGVLIPKLKKIFPQTKFVIIEEDVYFLGAYRRWINVGAWTKKFFRYLDYKKSMRIERKCLSMADLVVLNNEKDCKLLENNFFECKKMVVAPFFTRLQHVVRNPSCKDILFYGAMGRFENYLSAIWFIEKVFPKIEHLGFRFIVIGNKPHESLAKFNNDRNIFVTGFVDDVAPYFEKGLCLVAPLVAGAGVKIKILEAMSSGLPVLTNEIGIEGISAENEKEFFFCQTPEDYVEKILKIAKNPEIGAKIGECAKEFISKSYNYEKSVNDFYDAVLDLMDNNIVN